MAETIFDKVRLTAQGTEKSVQWYQAQIKKMGTINSNKLMQTRSLLTTRVLPGTLIMFLYDAKLKDTLPYYDAFPLVLPFRKTPDGFYGLNLHYLPYMARFKLLGYLSEYANNDKMDEDTRIIASWRVLNSSSKLNMIKPCVKRYLYSQVESKFLTIPYPDWVTASQLPVERFQGANKAQVWKESRKKY